MKLHYSEIKITFDNYYKQTISRNLLKIVTTFGGPSSVRNSVLKISETIAQVIKNNYNKLSSQR